MTVEIHPSAIVSPDAQLGTGCVVGPFCVIGAQVRLGSGNILHSHVVLEGNTEIGDANEFFPFASVGHAPQDLKYHGEDSRLYIGSKNIVRESVTIQPGTEGGGMETRVGDANLFMANSHVGHDSIVGDRNVLANAAALSGHCIVGSGVILGGLSGVHQFVRLGDLSFLAAGSMVNQDVPPFCMVQGDRAKLVGLNTVGLKRAFSNEELSAAIKRSYRKLFISSSGDIEKALSELNTELEYPEVKMFIDFVRGSERGLVSLRRSSSASSADEA